MQPVQFTPKLLFLVAAIVCFVIALLISLSVFNGGNEEAWKVGGFLALTLGFII